MYLCICKAVTDRQIRQAVEQGVRTMGDLSVRFGIGIECGKCIDSVREALDACLAAPPQDMAAAAPPAAAQAGAAPPGADLAPAPAAAQPASQQTAWFAIDL
ncbi:MAG: (2Fe-2S)-binding protein [Candidatus Competibacteraceae bacterium]|nr:(2Fe-2S)-binding protein [Candidatus Competibacteraceae bacterium]